MHKGPDFNVCNFRHPKKRGAFGMYDGFHPSFRPPASSSDLIQGQIDGIAVTWFKALPVPGKSDVRYDTVFSPDTSSKCKAQRKMHVWVYARNSLELEEIFKAASAIRLRERHPEPREQFGVSEMSLVATNPYGDRKEKWAEFRDPLGRYHRLRLGSRIGKDFGILKRITATSATVHEIYQTEDCDWEERFRVIDKARR